MHSANLIFLFLNKNICCGYSKELSQWDGSFEHPKNVLKLMGKKYLQFYAEKFCLSKPVFIDLIIAYIDLHRSNSGTLQTYTLYNIDTEETMQLWCHTKARLFTISTLIAGDPVYRWSVMEKQVTSTGYLFFHNWPPVNRDPAINVDMVTNTIWATDWDFQQYCMCDQQRLRPACAYVQSDQSHC